MNKELPELFARLFEAANKNVLPFQARMDTYNTMNAELDMNIAKKENDLSNFKNELAGSETQLHGILQMGDRMKYLLNASSHYDTITETEWSEHFREHLDKIQELIQYQMGLSSGWDKKVDTCHAFLDELRERKKCNEKGLNLATESWQVMTKLANAAFNHQSELEQPQQTAEEFRCAAFEIYFNRRHDLDVIIYLAQPLIDEHYSRIEQMTKNREKLEEAHQKLRGLNEQKERIQALGEKMSQWIWRFFGEADTAEVHQQNHELELADIHAPLQERIDKIRSEVTEYEGLQNEWLYLIERNAPDIEEYKEVVEQLMEVRDVVEEVVDKLEIEDVD